MFDKSQLALVENEVDKEILSQYLQASNNHEGLYDFEDNHLIYQAIPHLSFPSSWKVQILPGFKCAARFRILSGNAEVSVILDLVGRSSCYYPAWEVYPYQDDVATMPMLNIEELFEVIKRSIQQQLKSNEQLSSIKIESVANLKFKVPLILEPQLDESEQLISVKDPSIGLDVWAWNKEDLILEIHEQILMLWKEYAMANPENLTSDACNLKEKLLNAIEIER